LIFRLLSSTSLILSSTFSSMLFNPCTKKFHFSYFTLQIHSLHLATFYNFSLYEYSQFIHTFFSWFYLVLCTCFPLALWIYLRQLFEVFS
jgi:hypothetical protein